VAGVVLLLKYQWKAYWRRFSQGQAIAQVLLVFLLAWLIFIKLPPLLFQAAADLTFGRPEGIAQILLLFGFLWLFLLYEDASISLTPTNLSRFPLSLKKLLAVRILSMFISPVVMIIAIGSLLSLLPLLKARNPVLGIAAAILFLSLSVTAWLCLSHLVRIDSWRRGLLALAALIIIPAGASLMASGNQARPRLVSTMMLTPASLATSVANSESIKYALILLLLLLAGAAIAIILLFLSLRLSLHAEQPKLSSRIWKVDLISIFSIIPGRFGGLVGKEQRYFRKTYFPWLGLLFSLACCLALYKKAIPAIVTQTVIVLVFLIDFDLTTNFFGLDRASGLNRYLILPLTGREIALNKNLGLVVIVAAQITPILALVCWRFGWVETGWELFEATALLLAHLAWGNLRSVNNPYKMEFLQLSTRENLIYAMAGISLCSLPGITITYLVRSNSGHLFIKTASILFLTSAVYLSSLRFAGKKIEQRWKIILDRMS
jgi:hypothetical protein